MDVNDALRVTARDRNRIAAREDEMAGVEQQPHIVARRRHQPVDLLLGLHDRSHMVMEREPYAARAQMLRDRVQARDERRPSAGIERRPPRKRRIRIAVGAAMTFGEHHRMASHCREQREMSFDSERLVFGRPPCKLRAVPAGHEPQSVAREDRREHVGVARKLAAHFDAGVTGEPRFGQTHVERDIAAQLRHVVVRQVIG